MPANFFVDSNAIDKFRVLYHCHCEGSQDYTDMVFHVNGVLHDGDYCVSITTDQKSVS